MDIIQLDNDHSFAVEIDEKRARLVVYKHGVENICRTETIKNLKEFIQSGENHLFKGRLQLHKSAHGIEVFAKGKLIGSISNEEFMRCLEGEIQHKKYVTARRNDEAAPSPMH